MRRRGLPLVALILALALPQGAASARMAADCRAVTPGARLTIAADLWCPYSCAAGDPRPGYLVELMHRIFTPRGFEVEYLVMPWTRVLDSVRAGLVDAALGTVGDEARGLVVPATPAGHNLNALAVRRDDPWRWQGVDSLATRRLGVVAGYAYNAELDRWIARHSRNLARIQALSGSEAAVQNLRKLAAGRVDVVVDNRYVLQRSLDTWEGPPLRIEATLDGPPLYVAFSPAQPHAAACGRAFSAGVEQLRRSGELATLLRAYGVTDWGPASP